MQRKMVGWSDVVPREETLSTAAEGLFERAACLAVQTHR